MGGGERGALSSDAGGTDLSLSLGVSLVLCSHICAATEAFTCTHCERSPGQGWWGVLQDISWFPAPYRIPPCVNTPNLLHGLQGVASSRAT